MSGLNIFTSNRLEILAEQLAQIVRTPLSTPLQTEFIVVQSRGMERWISTELARHNGVCANCAFPFPNAFLEDILKRVMPDVPDIAPFDPDIMTFRIMNILPELSHSPGFEPIDSYLRDDPNHLKLFQLSKKLADLFDQYLVFRPEMILEWEANGQITEPAALWQKRLWQALVNGYEGLHRVRLRQQLFEKLNSPSSADLDLPERVSVFGISYLPKFHLQILVELARLFDLNIFLLNPCREYWGDIVSDWEMQNVRRRYPSREDTTDGLHLEHGNRLLASMGPLGRYFFDLINVLESKTYEQFEDPAAEATMLAWIQSDILNLRENEIPREAEAGADLPTTHAADIMPIGPHRLTELDNSIRMHSCHSPMREIEVLYDNLLAIFEADPELLPKDIIVLTPDIEAYAPYVHAVFDDPTHGNLSIPFSIADQSIRRASRLIDGFLSVLDLKGSRFGAAQVIRLLEFPGIKEKFDLDETDLPLIERWVRETRIRWGIDSRTRVEFGLPDFSENTWRAGIERLLLGYAMPGQDKLLFADILPYDHIEGSEAKILGRFLEFTDRLFSLVKDLEEPKRLGQWQVTCNAILDHLFLPGEDSERDLQTLRRLLEDMVDREIQSGFNKKIELDVVQAYLRHFLEKNSYGSGFMTGGVTFCAMLPMRSIPFKVICLVGMNNDSFPRDHQPLTFDLIAQYPRPGDRSRRYDDKYLFLESILSARKMLYISYVGQSIEDNTHLPPSVLVNELLDAIKKNFPQPGENILEQVVTRHRLQPFSPSYFRASSALFSYSEENMLASTRIGTREQPFFLIAQPVPLTPEETEQWRHLDLETLCRFFSNPAKFFLQRRFNIHLSDEVPVCKERETFELSPLERYEIEQNLVHNRLADAPVNDFYPIQRASGQLPHGAVGEFFFNEMSSGANRFVQKILRFSGGKCKKPLDVDLELAGVRLTGRLSDGAESGLVQIRYATRKVKDLLKIWIYHLVYCQTAPAHLQRCSFLMCKDTTLQFSDVTDSKTILVYLLELFRRGLSEPIHFFPESSFEYARHAHRGSQFESSGLSRARKKWLASDYAEYPGGESEDPYFALCFRGRDPIDATFKAIATGVFAPLLAHCTEIVL